jgi:hypothetical protein
MQLVRRYTQTKIMPEESAEEEIQEKEPILVSDDVIFEGLEDRILQNMNDVGRKAIHLHGALQFAAEPAGMSGPRFFKTWSESELPDEDGITF